MSGSSLMNTRMRSGKTVCDMPLRDDRSIRSPDMQKQKNTHTHTCRRCFCFMVAYYTTTPMTTFDVLFVCGTLILRIAGAFLIACLTSHTDRRCYCVCFSALHVDGRRSFNLHVFKTHQHCRRCVCFGFLFLVGCTRTRLSVHHLTCSQFSPSVLVHI